MFESVCGVGLLRPFHIFCISCRVPHENKECEFYFFFSWLFPRMLQFRLFMLQGSLRPFSIVLLQGKDLGCREHEQLEADR